jgi:hypothetical protein
MNTNNNLEQDNANTWNGATIDELKYMRAASLIRLEMQKDYLKRKVATSIPMLSSEKRGAVSSISSGMTKVQKILLFVKGVRLATNLFSYFKKSKK